MSDENKRKVFYGLIALTVIAAAILGAILMNFEPPAVIVTNGGLESWVSPPPEAEPESAPPVFDEDKINLNTATKEQLMTIKGIGAATAESILKYREMAGGFSRIEDIMNVKGIGAKKFESMKDYITAE